MIHGRLCSVMAIFAAVLVLSACSSTPSVPRGTVAPVVLEAQESAPGWQPAAPSSAGVAMPDDTALPVRKKLLAAPGPVPRSLSAVPASEGAGGETRRVSLASPAVSATDLDIALPVRKGTP